MFDVLADRFFHFERLKNSNVPDLWKEIAWNKLFLHHGESDLKGNVCIPVNWPNSYEADLNTVRLIKLVVQEI